MLNTMKKTRGSHTASSPTATSGVWGMSGIDTTSVPAGIRDADGLAVARTKGEVPTMVTAIDRKCMMTAEARTDP
jgi:hypothetical protein